MTKKYFSTKKLLFPLSVSLLLFTLFTLSFNGPGGDVPLAYAASQTTVQQAFTQASQQYGVPVAILQALCYMEGRLSQHGGSPSIDNGFGCMHLVKNQTADTLDQAAKDLNVSTQQLKTDMATNILGGADILHQDAIETSATHTLPTSLAGWSDAIARYSNATVPSTAQLYVNGLYQIINSGFSAQADDREIITLAPQQVQPANDTQAQLKNALTTQATMPTGCTNDGKVDYPGAIDCILDPNVYDCEKVSSTAPCNYDEANRPTDFSIDQIVIHDIEGTAQDALSTFQDPNSEVSIHYIVGSDGTVYQVLPEQDIAWQAGNYWYNEHSIGIEHAGYDETGFQWYNATEYLASAKLVAYLLKKYDLPLDRSHIVSHGTTPSPTIGTEPNHVDPGPYWLWPYYLQLIHEQGVPYPKTSVQLNTVTLVPKTGMKPYGANGTETAANFNFFYLYSGPSTASSKIPNMDAPGDITGETSNIESEISYAYTKKVKDPAGTGDTLYEIWYGVQDPTTTPTNDAHAEQVWLAVPKGDAVENVVPVGTQNVSLTSTDKSPILVYGRPTSGPTDVIGDAPAGSVFSSGYTVTEDGATTVWYEINYNHRQAWVQASNVKLVP